MAKRKTRKSVRLRSAKKNGPFQRLKPYLIGVFVFLFFFGVAFHYRNGLAYYLGFKSNKTSKVTPAQQRLSDVRNYTLLSKYEMHPVGLDISEYQGTILWDSVATVENDFPIRFVFVRATAGSNRPDRRFDLNWTSLKKKGLLRGAYHYYRPDENSARQAALFIKTVTLQRGDFPPVLDIEQMPKRQSMAQLKKGIANWLNLVEEHYGVQPILYSGERFYSDFLRDDFSEYTFWIANYNFFVEDLKTDWRFWQFTERGSAKGIDGFVDVNIFNGTEAELQLMTLGNGAFAE